MDEILEFAKAAAKKRHLPLIVKDSAEFKGKLDALSVDQRQAKYHLEAARPLIEAGIPIFLFARLFRLNKRGHLA